MLDGFDSAPECADTTLPRARLVGALVDWGDGEQELVAVDLVIAINYLDVVCKDCNLFTQGRLFPNFGAAGEGVTHNRDQHVEEGDLSDKCGGDEDDQRSCRISSILNVAVTIAIELAKTEHVLIEDNIGEVTVEVRREDTCLGTLVENE